MLDNLRTGLRSALKKIVGASDINEELIDSLSKDIQRSLLQSDVNVRQVLSITKNLKERALKEQPPKGLTKKDHIITILYNEISSLLGYKGTQILHIDKAHWMADILMQTLHLLKCLVMIAGKNFFQKILKQIFIIQKKTDQT